MPWQEFFEWKHAPYMYMYLDITKLEMIWCQAATRDSGVVGSV